MRRPLWAAWILVTAGTMTACHSYTPVTTPPPGSTVRVQIPVRSALDDPNAPPRTQAVEGEVLESGDTIVLATRSRQEYGAYREIVQYDTLRLGPDQRYGVEVREFSSSRSIVLGVGLMAVVAGAAVAAFGTGGGDTDPPGDPPPPQPAILGSALISSILSLFGGS